MTKSVAFLILTLCLASEASAGTRFRNPTVQGAAVDWCLLPARNCGRAVAVRLCSMWNLGTPIAFKGARSRVPTRILGTGTFCTVGRFDHCDRISDITCSGGRID
jgi:hypothetical protein